ncbi:hypothetical protein [Streptosporangium vulgare]|uniref:hypothetical protein n=1 Tax=Streptosporangium vulgare TaxID=46190 RepID=UPI0031D70906
MAGPEAAGEELAHGARVVGRPVEGRHQLVRRRPAQDRAKLGGDGGARRTACVDGVPAVPVSSTMRARWSSGSALRVR